MIKDIPQYTVEDVALAVVKELNEHNESVWNVYVVNMKKEPIEGVLVSSKGYGIHKGSEVKTTMLRHFLDVIPPHSYSKVEPIMDELFGLNNEYWLSFYLHGIMYDKKYIFLPETIKEEHFVTVPFIGKKGVMII